MTSDDKVNILLVDDQPSKLLTYEVILRELGENLIKASSGKEALEQLLKNEIAEAYLYARNVERGIVTDNWSGVAAPFRRDSTGGGAGLATVAALAGVVRAIARVRGAVCAPA